MPISLNPYLNFPGTTREAMTFYQGIFGGKLDIATFGDFGAVEGDDADGVMHAHLETDAGFTFMASDSTPEHRNTVGDNISMSLSGERSDADVLRGYFAALTEDGTVAMPLGLQMWGDEFGMCVDRFGVSWMVNIAGDPAE